MVLQSTIKSQQSTIIWEDGELLRNLDYAAGFMVRRFTKMKANPNIKAENRTRVAIDSVNGNTVELVG